jgi:hypothetical protein
MFISVNALRAISNLLITASDYDLVARATAGLTVLLPLRGVSALSSHIRPSNLSLNRKTVSCVVNRTWGLADVVRACRSPMR